MSFSTFIHVKYHCVKVFNDEAALQAFNAKLGKIIQKFDAFTISK
jgi:hypothetical protein